MEDFGRVEAALRIERRCDLWSVLAVCGICLKEFSVLMLAGQHDRGGTLGVSAREMGWD